MKYKGENIMLPCPLFTKIRKMTQSISTFSVKIEFCIRKSEKKAQIQEIMSKICALLNTNGGRLEILLENFTKIKIHDFIRGVEQSLRNIIGGLATTEKIIQESVTPQRITFIILALEDSLCTLNYNMFMPGIVQVQTLQPNEPIISIERVVEGKRITGNRVMTKLGTHHAEFIKGKECERDFELCNFECYPTELGRDVKNELTNKESKFKSQVSAFANDNGGHIYLGIKSGAVVGVVLDENEHKVIESEVEKALEKLVWGNEKPTKAKDWDVYFEPVKDEKDEVVPQTFVIIVSITPYKGGVFTMKPESYHIVQNKVEEMDFNTWKEQLLYRRTLRQCNNIDEHVNSIKLEGLTIERLI